MQIPADKLTITPMPSERDKANEAPDNLLVCQPLDVSRGRREVNTRFVSANR